MAIQIRSFKPVVPMIYAYNTPGVSYHNGWTKIGYTEKQTVNDRIRQQTRTANIKYVVAWQDNAMYKDGSGTYFTDHDFHSYLEHNKQIDREPGTEWFKIDGQESHKYFGEFSMRRDSSVEESTYTLRTEQKAAVALTETYFAEGGKEFLWNAKPRFGKTLSAYDLIMKMKAKNVLVVTNRPSIANSWADDFAKFVAWQGNYIFVSETESLKEKIGVLSREEYLGKAESAFEEGIELGMVAFESLQGLKGSVYFGGNYNKLKWIKDLSFDLLIVDESQEGVDTVKTERAFDKIQRKHTLYLSGTPFKQLAGDQFSEQQIYNWSYTDEQEAKENWDREDYNPYERLPRLAMFTYQLSGMIQDEIAKGLELPEEGENVDYAFDLNEFFATNNNKKFIYEEKVKKFLKALVTQEKYPFSTAELRKELSHTLWLLNRVDSAKALAKLLKEDPVFGEYKIVIAAGDGRMDDEDDHSISSAFNRVKEAIANHDRTITLSVGQLTVGVTIPEWSGVLMLCNMQSPSAYIQAAFRAQNPCFFTNPVDKRRYCKETAYVFDFDPARTLRIFDEFANNLRADTVSGRGSREDHENNIRRLLNFFPVLGEDTEGEMVELDAAQVLSIPVRIQSQEVLRRGFMSNLLFRNISNVFGAPGIVREILNKLNPAQEESRSRRTEDFTNMENVSVDSDGQVIVGDEIVIGRTQDIFGDKIYDIQEKARENVKVIRETGSVDEISTMVEDAANKVVETVKGEIVAPIAEQYHTTVKATALLEKQVEDSLRREIARAKDDYDQQRKIIQAELENDCQQAETQEQIEQAKRKYKTGMEDAFDALKTGVDKVIQATVSNKPQELIELLERRGKENEKKIYEDKVREHLRGFSRTIPSFIMAYGDKNLKLANFDDYTEDDVFLEVTGITEADFRFLRDGGDYLDPETGENEHFEGHLFNEDVFDNSIQEFLKKKQELANYFDETLEEDIFDYIPPQKTNQIFTPRWIVKKMVDELEKNNPGCFDDPNNTFADLYMKSGLYITEIVKRLYRSKKMKKTFPDKEERIRHILRKQVYGMAPTRIIYLIATNYILGFDERLKNEIKNFVQENAAKASENGTLQEVVDKHFG